MSKSAGVTLVSQAGSITGIATADGVTDKNGRYSFSYVPAGLYNILEGNGNMSLLDSVHVSSDTTPVEAPNDTLFPPGGIKGVVNCDPPMHAGII